METVDNSLMISSSWPSVLWFFAFLQTWFQPYVNVNPLLYHGIYHGYY